MTLRGDFPVERLTSMRVLYGLALFVGLAIALTFLIGALGGVGSVELLLVIVLAAAITLLWLSRSRWRRTAAHQK
jgi:hypothetical protein